MKFKMDEKWVVINDTRRKILEAAAEAIKTKVIPHLPADTENTFYEIDSKNEQERNKLSAKIVGYFEWIVGEHGSKKKLLQKLNKDLDHPAWILCDEYRNCLFQRLRDQNRGSRDTEGEEIKSRFVLICEIVLRFAVIALSREENSQVDGELYIDALEEFCINVKKQGWLNNYGSLTDFGQFFSTGHDYWLKCLRDAASIVKSIHSNKRAIGNTLDYLLNVKYLIMRQIVALQDMGSIAIEDLSDNWISSTFRRNELQLLGYHDDDSKSEDDELVLVAKNSLTSNQDIILKKININNRERVSSLYKLLNDTNLLLSVAKQIDMLMNETGWVLILLGAFKPNVLSGMIDLHHEQCQDLLTLDKDDLVFAGHLGAGLVKYNSTNMYHFDTMARESSANLMALQDPKVLNRMVKLIGGSLGTLVSLQERLSCEVVDKGRLGSIMPALLRHPGVDVSSSVMIEDLDQEDDQAESRLKEEKDALRSELEATKIVLHAAQEELLATKERARQSEVSQKEVEENKQLAEELKTLLEKKNAEYKHQQAIQKILTEDLKAYHALGVPVDQCKKFAELDACIQVLENDFNPSEQELVFAQALREQFNLIRANHQKTEARQLCDITLKFVKDFTLSRANRVNALKKYESEYSQLSTSSRAVLFAKSVATVIIAAVGVIVGAVIGIGAGAIVGALGGPGGGAAGALLGLCKGSITGLGVGLAVGSALTGVASGCLAKHLLFKQADEFKQTQTVIAQAKKLQG